MYARNRSGLLGELDKAKSSVYLFCSFLKYNLQIVAFVPSFNLLRKHFRSPLQQNFRKPRGLRSVLPVCRLCKQSNFLTLKRSYGSHAERPGGYSNVRPSRLPACAKAVRSQKHSGFPRHWGAVASIRALYKYQLILLLEA